MTPALRLALLPLVLLILVSCSRLTQENYDRLGVGMRYDAAIDVLGEPSSCDAVGAAKSCRWGSDDKNIEAKILGDRIVFLTSQGLD